MNKGLLSGLTLPDGAVPYTPVWGTDGAATAPVIGNGVLLGRYALLGGGLVWFHIAQMMASGTTFGAGSSAPWMWSLPPIGAPKATEIAGSSLFFGRYPASLWGFDNSAGSAFTGAAYAFGTNDAGSRSVQGMVKAFQHATTSQFHATSPITWATSDEVWISGIYELA